MTTQPGDVTPSVDELTVGDTSDTVLDVDYTCTGMFDPDEVPEDPRDVP